MPLLPALLTIGPLVAESGEAVKALRYWTDLGLLPHEYTGSDYRRSPAESAERVQFIRSANRLGGILHILTLSVTVRGECHGLPAIDSPPEGRH
jgi:hypothetical protein